MLDADGTVCVYNTRTNPSTLLSSWTAPTDNSIGVYSCLAMYEDACNDEDIEEIFKSDKWLGVTLEARALSHVTSKEENPLDKRREGYCLLVAATSTGCLAIVSSEGEVVYSIQSPNSGAVTKVVCNPHKSQVVSAGQGESVCALTIIIISTLILCTESQQYCRQTVPFSSLYTCAADSMLLP